MALEDDFDKNDFAKEIYAEDFDQGHAMYLGDRVKLGLHEMMQLKEIVDKELNPDYDQIETEQNLFNVDINQIDSKDLIENNLKFTRIWVTVEQLKAGVLVKVGPCDLSGVGGHQVREQMIKYLVNKALAASNLL